MKAKVKKGHDILFMFTHGCVYIDKKCMIINFKNKYTYKSHIQKGNHLLIETTEGQVDIVFSGETPRLIMDNFCKDQLVLKVEHEKQKVFEQM